MLDIHFNNNNKMNCKHFLRAKNMEKMENITWEVIRVSVFL